MICEKKDFCIHIQEEQNKKVSEEIEIIKKDLMKIIDFINLNSTKNLENIDSINDIIENEDNSIDNIKSKLESIYKVLSEQNNKSKSLKTDLAKNYENILLENEKLKKDEFSGFFNLSYLYNILEELENFSNKNIFIIELKDFLNKKNNYNEKDVDNILKIFFLLIDRSFKKDGNQIFRIAREKLLIIYTEDSDKIKEKIEELEKNLFQKAYTPKNSENQEKIKLEFNKYYIEIDSKDSKKIKEEISSIL